MRTGITHEGTAESAVTTAPVEKQRWRAPRWLLIISYVVTILLPLFGQLIGFVIGVVLIILPHRRWHGLLLVVVSIVMLMGWFVVLAGGGGGGTAFG